MYSVGARVNRLSSLEIVQNPPAPAARYFSTIRSNRIYFANKYLLTSTYGYAMLHFCLASRSPRSQAVPGASVRGSLKIESNQNATLAVRKTLDLTSRVTPP
jgi:hypothetical protein